MERYAFLNFRYAQWIERYAFVNCIENNALWLYLIIPQRRLCRQFTPFEKNGNSRCRKTTIHDEVNSLILFREREMRYVEYFDLIIAAEIIDNAFYGRDRFALEISFGN